jgi:hypothetical protein
MKLNLFGCSHTDLLYNYYFSKHFDSHTSSTGGYSNFNIIDEVYKFVENEYDKEKDVLLIQYTYTNRWWIPNNLPESRFGFHSLDTSHAPIYTYNPSFMKDDLKKFYELYITYFWDYEPALYHLLKNITLLKAYLESKGVIYHHYLWTDGGNDEEWKENSIKKDSTSIDVTSKYKELNLLSIDGRYHIGDYMIEKGWCHSDGHVYNEKQSLLGEKLYKEFIKKTKINLDISK